MQPLPTQAALGVPRWEVWVRATTGCLVGLAVAWSFWGTIGKPDCQDMDFGAYYRAGQAVRASQSPYQVDEHGPLGAYSYAPAYAYLVAPLTYVDYLVAVRIGLVLNWVATAVALLLTLRLVLGHDPRRERWWAVGLLTVAPIAGYLWANLRVGQVGVYLLLGCLGWFACRRTRPFLGGTLLAGACALKLAPFALVPYLVLRRDRRALAGWAAGLTALFLAPAFWVGWDGTLQIHREWMTHTLSTQVPEQTYRLGNQSLLAQLARLPGITNGYVCTSPEALARLQRGYPVVVMGLGALIYGWIWLDRRRRPGDVQREVLHLAVLLVFLTLAHPRAWRCNYVALMVPAALVALRGLEGNRLRAGWIPLAAVLAACIWPTNGVGEHAWSWGAWLLQGKHFWGGVLLAGACLGTERRGDREPAGLSRRSGRQQQGPSLATRPRPAA